MKDATTKVLDGEKATKSDAAAPPPPEKSIKATVDRWCTNKLNDPVSRSSEAAGEQVLEAVVELPERIEDAGDSVAHRDSAIDQWFEDHFHKPPVSEDTRLYNTLHAAKEELKAMLSADA